MRVPKQVLFSLALTAWLLAISSALHACEPIPQESVVQTSAPTLAQAGRSITIVYAPGTWIQSEEPTTPQMDLSKVIKMIAQNCDEDVSGKTPTADTAFQRHAGLLPNIPQEIREVFVAAEIARSTQVSINILTPLTEPAQSAEVRFRAYIEMSLRILRSADGIPLSRAGEFLDQAEKLAPSMASLPDGTNPVADITFQRAVICWRTQKPLETCRAYLNFALEQDVYFAAARQLRIELNDATLKSPEAKNLVPCNAVLAQVLYDTENLLRGINLQKNRMEIADNLDAAAADGNVVLNMAAAHAYARAGVFSKSELALNDARTRLEQDGQCHDQLRVHFAEFEEVVLAQREE